MHVFLTGPVQIGKSTLLRASLDALQPQKLGGFRTVSAQPQADGSRPVYLHPACSPDELHESANRIGIRRPGLGIVSFPAAFETAGLAALAGAENCDLLLMDEARMLHSTTLCPSESACSMDVNSSFIVDPPS